MFDNCDPFTPIPTYHSTYHCAMTVWRWVVVKIDKGHVFLDRPIHGCDRELWLGSVVKGYESPYLNIRPST